MNEIKFSAFGIQVKITRGKRFWDNTAQDIKNTMLIRQKSYAANGGRFDDGGRLWEFGRLWVWYQNGVCGCCDWSLQINGLMIHKPHNYEW